MPDRRVLIGWTDVPLGRYRVRDAHLLQEPRGPGPCTVVPDYYLGERAQVRQLQPEIIVHVALKPVLGLVVQNLPPAVAILAKNLYEDVCVSARPHHVPREDVNLVRDDHQWHDVFFFDLECALDKHVTLSGVEPLKYWHRPALQCVSVDNLELVDEPPRTEAGIVVPQLETRNVVAQRRTRDHKLVQAAALELIAVGIQQTLPTFVIRPENLDEHVRIRACVSVVAGRHDDFVRDDVHSRVVRFEHSIEEAIAGPFLVLVEPLLTGEVVPPPQPAVHHHDRAEVPRRPEPLVIVPHPNALKPSEVTDVDLIGVLGPLFEIVVLRVVQPPCTARTLRPTQINVHICVGAGIVLTAGLDCDVIAKCVVSVHRSRDQLSAQ